jgi:RNA polymerase sigma factor (sigma-70 family)
MPGVPAVATSAIERVFREEYGRAVAVLVGVFGDIDVAEEAVQDAFAAAVRRWPSGGLPPSPAGWIITTARNRAIDRYRREASREDRHAQAALLHVRDQPAEEGPVRDDRLRLIFTCCHPALATTAQVALTLRLLGGLTTVEIARAFLVPEPTMAQRLVRAKGKIRDARIPYRGPGRGRPPRPHSDRAGRRLPHLQRGLHGQLGRPAGPRGPLRGGHPARTAAGRADARRAGGHGAARAHAARRVAPGHPNHPGRRPRVAGRPGPRPLGAQPRRRRPGHRPAVPAAQPARPLPDPGGGQRRPQRRAGRGCHRLVADPAALRPALDARPEPGRASTARSRWPRSRDRTRRSPSSTASSSVATTCSTPSAPTCSDAWAAPPRRRWRTRRRPSATSCNGAVRHSRNLDEAGTSSGPARETGH